MSHVAAHADELDHHVSATCARLKQPAHLGEARRERNADSGRKGRAMHRQQAVNFSGIQLLQLLQSIRLVQLCTEPLTIETITTTRRVHIV